MGRVGRRAPKLATSPRGRGHFYWSVPSKQEKVIQKKRALVLRLFLYMMLINYLKSASVTPSLILISFVINSIFIGPIV